MSSLVLTILHCTFACVIIRPLTEPGTGLGLNQLLTGAGSSETPTEAGFRPKMSCHEFTIAFGLALLAELKLSRMRAIQGHYTYQGIDSAEQCGRSMRRVFESFCTARPNDTHCSVSWSSVRRMMCEMGQHRFASAVPAEVVSSAFLRHSASGDDSALKWQSFINFIIEIAVAFCQGGIESPNEALGMFADDVLNLFAQALPLYHSHNPRPFNCNLAPHLQELYRERHAIARVSQMVEL